MVIDNFPIIRPHLAFEKSFRTDGSPIGDTFDRYIVHIIKRAKDDGGKNFGSNESQRLIKTFEIGSLEYFDRKEETIKDLCRANKARAYVLPQVRSSRDCLMSLVKAAIDCMDVPTVRIQHLVRSALCKTHKSRKRMFVFDLDSERYDAEQIAEYYDEIKRLVRETGRDGGDVYLVPTPNGYHIVSPAFDRSEFKRRRPEARVEDIVPDNMTLLFFDDGKES